MAPKDKHQTLAVMALAPKLARQKETQEEIESSWWCGLKRTLSWNFIGWFGVVWWTPSIGRKFGVPRGILPHIQTGLTIGNPD